MFKKISIAIIIFLLSFPYVNMVFEFIPDLDLKEKRELTKKPIFSISELYNYLDNYKAYFEDHFGFRNYLVKANMTIKTDFLDKSPVPSKVIMGKEKWLFVSPNMDLTINNKYNIYSENSLKLLELSLLYKTRQFAKHGIKYYVMIIPEKSYIYPEYLPEFYSATDIRNNFDRMFDFLSMNKELNIINVNQTLLNEKKNSTYPIYFKNDSHWNAIGAFSVYNQFLRVLQKDFPANYTTLERKFSLIKKPIITGDLADLISMSGKVNDWSFYRWPIDRSNLFFDESMIEGLNTHHYTHVNEAFKTNPNIVLLHDSFGQWLKGWLVNDFHKLDAIAVNRYNFEVDSVAKLHPDIVLHELVPRNSVLADVIDPIQRSF